MQSFCVKNNARVVKIRHRGLTKSKKCVNLYRGKAVYKRRIIMQRFGIGEMEMKMAKLLWDREGIGSGAVVKLCAEEFGWKKSTTYTMLRRLCEHGLFQNVNSIVTSVMSEDEYKAKVGTDLVNDKFEGSLPMFVAAFTKKNKLSAKDKKELLAIIEGSRK